MTNSVPEICTKIGDNEVIVRLPDPTGPTSRIGFWRAGDYDLGWQCQDGFRTGFIDEFVFLILRANRRLLVIPADIHPRTDIVGVINTALFTVFRNEGGVAGSIVVVIVIVSSVVAITRTGGIGVGVGDRRT